MGNDIIWQALLAILILFGIFLTFMSAKVWRWYALLFFVLMFAVSVWFARNAVAVAKTRLAWMQQIDTLQKTLEQTEANLLKVEYGDIGAITQPGPYYDNAEANITPDVPLPMIEAALRRAVADRDRVWRYCQPNIPPGEVTTDTEIQVQIPVTEAEAGTDPASAPAPITLDAAGNGPILFAFREEALDGRLYPRTYVGQYKVSAVAGRTITIKPVEPLDPDQLAKLRLGSTWSLYVRMPLDSHYIFATTPPGKEENSSEPATQNTNLTLPLFGKVTEQQVRNWLPNSPIVRMVDGEQVETPLPADVYERIIQRIVRDGTKATPGEDLDEETGVRVKFLRAQEYVVDSDDSQGVENRFWFDSSGRSEISLLSRDAAGTGDEDAAKRVKFAKDDLAVFDKETADALERDGIVEVDEEIFIRPLADFQYELFDVSTRLNKLSQTRATLSVESAGTVAANDQVKRQIVYRQDEKTKLEQDLTQFTKERDEAGAYLSELNQLLQSRRTELSDLYKKILQLERELNQLSRDQTPVLTAAGG